MKYSKLIAAIIGLVALALVNYTNVLPNGSTVEGVATALLAVLTAFGVYQVENKEA